LNLLKLNPSVPPPHNGAAGESQKEKPMEELTRLFDRPPNSSLKPNSKLQAQYRRTTRSFNDLIALLKAA